MRLLLVTDTYPPDINGVARTLAMLAKGLQERGHEVTVVTTLEADEAGEQGEARRVMNSLPLPGYPGLRIGFASTRQMMEMLSSLKPHVLYVATETPLGIASIRAAAKLGVPVVSGFHTNFQSYLEDYHLPGLEAVAQGFLRSLHNQTARTLTPSVDTARMLEGWGIRNVGVMGRGVDTDLFHPARRSETLRASWGASAQTPVAIYVGRMAAEKNLPLAARAFTAFLKQHPEGRCVFVGDGPRLNAMRDEFPEFHYAGMQKGEDLAAHYASGDVFLFPSLSETFGNVVLEAMASGLPTVAFDYAAPRLLIQTGKTGWLAAFQDESAFLEQAQTAASDLQALQPGSEMRLAVRQAALSFSWQRVIAQFEDELSTTITTFSTSRGLPSDAPALVASTAP